MTLYILNYNNYYNRLVKVKADLLDYQPYIIHTLTGTNWNPDDNIDTEHIFGSVDNQYNGAGDYCLVVNTSG